MSRLHDRQNKLSITKYLRLAGNALFLLVNGSGNEIQLFGGVETIDAARVLTAKDFGKTFLLDNLAGAAVTIPSAVGNEGATLSFQCKLTTTSNGYVLTAPANSLAGYVHNALAQTAAGGAGDVNVITFVNLIAGVGDSVSMVSDGLNWNISGSAAAAVSLTVA